ncbi:MAG: hypothetical protein JST92_17605, partial [Deltaproteobacteria bacterium]|nr:hypothetical protein [Deltaproteobacteria bacterium]
MKTINAASWVSGLGQNPFPKAWLVSAILGIGVMLTSPANAAGTCATASSQVNHDWDLARDCASGTCIERVCVDTLYRQATLCGHGFSGSPTVKFGADIADIVSYAVPAAGAPCGAYDESLVVSLDEIDEGQQKLTVTNGTKASDPFFVKIGELAGPQGTAGPQGPAGPQGAT